MTPTSVPPSRSTWNRPKVWPKTAELLFIHRNTVRYRIHKCTELINSDLEDGNEIFAFILSLRILEYRKKVLPPAGVGALNRSRRCLLARPPLPIAHLGSSAR